MAISSEIEKLEKRWQQTSGLVFAPLAEAYRKAGLQARALEILEQGLALHAEYGPALIVRARCHLDTGDFSAAEEAFNQALVRDPMDPIALRGLADVCERTGRLTDAIERLRLLVDVDPRNSEARQVLDRLMATPTVIPQAVIEEPVPAPVQEYVEPVKDQLDSLDFEVVNLSAVESLPAIPTESSAPPVEEDFLVQSFAVEPLEVPSGVEEPSGPILWTPAPHVEPIESAAAVEAEPPVIPELAIIPTSEPPAPAEAEIAPLELASAIEFVAVTESIPAVEEIPVVEAAPPVVEVVEAVEAAEVVEVVEVVEAVEAVEAVVAVPEPETVSEPWVEPAYDEFETIDEVDEFVAPEAVEAVAREPVLADVPELVEEPTPAEYASDVEFPTDIAPEPLVAEVTAEADSLVEAHGEQQPVLIVTESMAELFLRQGHRELALAVYRQLLERSPDADHLQGAIARLEQELAPPPAPEPAAAPKTIYAAAETGGRSIERRLQAVLHAPPPSTASTVLPPAIEPGAEPTRPAADSLSLAAVFGDEPAKTGRAEEAPAQASASEPSYDEFFGTGPSEPAAAPAPRGEGEDLRQFNEWLKGLKR